MNNNQTILIVDDIKENIDVLLKLLGKQDVIPVFDGVTAIEIATHEKNIDLILLAVVMPYMDGFEVAKKLKKDPKTVQIPIIFLTTKNNEEDIQKGFELGGVDYITKPFNANELLSRVNTHLKLRAYEKNLEQQTQKAIYEVKLKEQMLYQQSKQASLGELLMHISHQWKQPLASLASINLLNKMKLTNSETLEKELLLKSCITSEDLIMYMSSTIETFQNFYKPSYQNRYFFLEEAIKSVLSIVEATFYFNDITIQITSDEQKKTYANANEITQVIFSILNNAKDIFMIRQAKNPEIHISIGNQKISISDNGGGIDEELFSNIFEPFSTLHNKKGIGLHLAKNLITKNNGLITASNTQEGAIFTMEFTHG